MATYQSIRYNVDYQGNAGSLMPISTFTSDGSDSNATFTSGIDSTYEEYLFIFNNIHPETDNTTFGFNGSTDSGSNYNVAKTSTQFRAEHDEGGSSGTLVYRTANDLAQGTGVQILASSLGADNDHTTQGYLHLFDPSSTTYIKHFIARISTTSSDDQIMDFHVAGYCNTTSAVDAAQFSMTTGNIDAGDICLYGIN